MSVMLVAIFSFFFWCSSWSLCDIGSSFEMVKVVEAYE